uniref:Uncharacterized protein n=1 Tax=Romanomermis culicivorax TaxID=13658 RepID=A0A915JBE2_ROMCU
MVLHHPNVLLLYFYDIDVVAIFSQYKLDMHDDSCPHVGARKVLDGISKLRLVGLRSRLHARRIRLQVRNPARLLVPNQPSDMTLIELTNSP